MVDKPKTVADLAQDSLDRLVPLKDLLAQNPPWWQYEIQLRLRKALYELVNDPDAASRIVDAAAEAEFLEYLEKLSIPLE